MSTTSGRHAPAGRRDDRGSAPKIAHLLADTEQPEMVAQRFGGVQRRQLLDPFLQPME